MTSAAEQQQQSREQLSLGARARGEERELSSVRERYGGESRAGGVRNPAALITHPAADMLPKNSDELERAGEDLRHLCSDERRVLVRAVTQLIFPLPREI